MNGNFVHQLFVLLDFFDESLNGELQSFFEYLLDIDNQIKKSEEWYE